MQLERGLTLFQVFAIGVGGMMAGLFLLPGLAYEIAGPAVLLSYGLCAAIALTGALSQAELISAMPKAGGAYFYVARAMGPMVGGVYGLITWFSLALKSAYLIAGLGMTIEVALGGGGYVWIAVSLSFVFMGLNLLGVKKMGRIQGILVVVILTALVIYVGRALPDIDVRNYHPFMEHGLGAVFAGAGFMFVTFGGLLKVASVAEEVQNPGRVVPMGMISSLIVVIVTYFLVIYSTIGIHGGAPLAGSRSPISEGGAIIFGSGGMWIYWIMGLLAVTLAANAGIMSAARYPLALARDGVFPEFMAAINERFHTPHRSIIMTGAIVLVFVMMDLKLLVMTASAVLILTYLATCATVIILREGLLQNYRPVFRCPLYPYLQIAGLIGLTALLVMLQIEAILITAGLIAGGSLLYWLSGRIKSTREYALLHLIERITARELTSGTLESELKDIIRERDDIFKDRFDELVEDCPILDVSGAVNAKAFFEETARILGERLGHSPEMLLDLFMKREAESTTVLSPDLAIPHVIVEGEKEFSLLLARSREGIFFSEESPKVHTVFLLIGSRDERPFHLRALAAIAQIVSNMQFEEMWMSARDMESLRDLVLLAERKRQPRI